MARSRSSDTVLADALDRFYESQSATDYNRISAYEDIRFARLSEQWPPEIVRQRRAEGRPVLTTNVLNALIHHVVNNARMSKPAIKVSPVDNGADADTAEVISGLCRAIERNSTAPVAYDSAIEGAVSCGFGFFRISIDYAHPESFSLEARIERIANPLSVHWDPSSTRFDAADWEYGFVSDFLTKDAFKARYPKAAEVSWDGGSQGDTTQWWLDEDRIRIAEYWLRTEKKCDLVMLSSGLVVREDRLAPMAKAAMEAGGLDLGAFKDDDLIAAWMAMNGLEETRRRESTYHEVTRRIMSGVEVLEEDPWPGSTIPICPVWGEEVFLDGRRYLRSLIRDAKDPQMMRNFWRSASTELVALAPRAPWVMAEGQMPTDANEAMKWQTANTRSYSALTYTVVQGAQAPVRVPFAGVPAGALQEALSANEDIQTVTNIYPSSIGQRSEETSGRAILARERQGDIGSFHFIDNLSRAIQYAGRVLVEIIPAVYSPRETVRILGEDQKEKVVRLVSQDGGTTEPGLDGQERLYNLAVGNYDVTVSTGPSYATQREETREVLTEIMQRVPGAAALVGDVVVENMDFPGNDKIAKRLQLLLPPQIQQAEGIVPPPMPMAPGMPGQPPGTPIPGAPPAQPGPAPASRPAGVAPGQ